MYSYSWPWLLLFGTSLLIASTEPSVNPLTEKRNDESGATTILNDADAKAGDDANAEEAVDLESSKIRLESGEEISEEDREAMMMTGSILLFVGMFLFLLSSLRYAQFLIAVRSWLKHSKLLKLTAPPNSEEEARQIIKRLPRYPTVARGKGTLLDSFNINRIGLSSLFKSHAYFKLAGKRIPGLLVFVEPVREGVSKKEEMISIARKSSDGKLVWVSLRALQEGDVLRVEVYEGAPSRFGFIRSFFTWGFIVLLFPLVLLMMPFAFVKVLAGRESLANYLSEFTYRPNAMDCAFPGVERKDYTDAIQVEIDFLYKTMKSVLNDFWIEGKKAIAQKNDASESQLARNNRVPAEGGVDW